MMMLDRGALALDDRVALVTGAGAGIGEAIALAMMRCGASVAICDRNPDTLAATVGQLEALASGDQLVIGAAFDVRDHDALAAFVEDVAGRAGAIHVLVNNAGGTFKAGFETVNPKGERALVDLNFTSAADAIRLALPHIPPGSAIINVTSVEAHRAAPGYAIYSAMKAALENLTRSLALELGAREIRVNCIAPDAIPTPGTGPMQLSTPLPGPGLPDDVAGAALYLASPLSRFVTGTTLHVDGGSYAAGGWRRKADGDYEL